MNDYTRWLNQPLDAELREELESVKNDPDALHDRSSVRDDIHVPSLGCTHPK